MKTYKDLHTLTETAQAMDAGKVVEFYHSIKIEWVPAINIARNTKYRTVEETELPEQGDEILTWTDCEEEAQETKFVAFWKGKIITESPIEAGLRIRSFWKWPKEKKPEPREWWIREGAQYMNACVKRKGEMTVGADFIHVIEVLEDE